MARSWASDGAELTDFCDDLATAIVAEITANAEAVISITTAGLQTSTAAGSPTAAPAPTEKTLPIR